LPTRDHEIPLRIIQNQPAMVPVLLKEALGIDVPPHTEVINTSSVLTNCDPMEFNSDGAALLRDGDRNVLAVVVERQNGRDYGKRASWPAYLVTLHTRLECPAVLVVLCPSEAMAKWSAKPISIGHPGFDLAPLAIGPSRMPIVVDSEQARALPELAVLSAHAHGDTDPRTLKAVVEALDSTSENNRAFYYDFVLAGLNEAARKDLEGLMSVAAYEWQSDFAQKYVGMGREQGREEGVALSVITVLEERGLTVSDGVRARIIDHADLETLKKAITVERPDDLFD
jgi:hypothetical protein